MLLAFPVPWDATELLDTTGHHLRERTPQRRPFTFGTHLRESRRGRPGADATLLLAAGRPGFGFETGPGARHPRRMERKPPGARRAGRRRARRSSPAASCSRPGEVILAPGESLTSPWVIGSWGDGLTELSHRFHDEWRRPPAHPRRPRPVTLNTWEAVYFDHALERLDGAGGCGRGSRRRALRPRRRLVRRPARRHVGARRLVSSTTTVWPDGLHPARSTTSERLGMEFGLWVEPEMVNPDSDLARAHPDWILRGRMALPPSARQQQVLDLAHPEAYALHRRAAARDPGRVRDRLPQVGPQPRPRRRRHRAGGRRRACTTTPSPLYRLLDELKAGTPASRSRAARRAARASTSASSTAPIASGRATASTRSSGSTNQRYTASGRAARDDGHAPDEPRRALVGPHRRPRAQRRRRAVRALRRRVGPHQPPTTRPARRVAPWVALAKRLRPLIATGRTVRRRRHRPGIDVRGIVAEDAASAVFTITQVGHERSPIRRGGSGCRGSTRPPLPRRVLTAGVRAPMPASPRSSGAIATRSSPGVSSPSSDSAPRPAPPALHRRRADRPRSDQLPPHSARRRT